MKIIGFIFLLVSSFQFIYGQEKTYGAGKEGLMEKRGGLGSLVIIPFEDKMYLSDADASIGKETGIGPGELMTKFRTSLIESLTAELSRNWDVQTFHEKMIFGKAGLEFVHSCRKYQYIPVSDEVIQANDSTLEKRQVKKNQKQPKQSGVHDGEIETYSDDREKYMSMQIKNDSLLTFLNRNLKSDYYLFLNEFDIRYQITDPDKIASGGLTYRLKIHFTCLDKTGEEFVAGAVSADVPSSSGNIYEVIQQGIPVLSEKLSTLIRKFKIKADKNQ